MLHNRGIHMIFFIANPTQILPTMTTTKQEEMDYFNQPSPDAFVPCETVVESRPNVNALHTLLN